MKRTIVIGDIHGALRALQQVFERSGVTAADKLIFLGDYVDGWSESAGVVDYLLGLEQTNDCVFLKGNHDEWCEEWLRTGKLNTSWLNHGGEETIGSYAEAGAATRSWHLIFLEHLPYYFIDADNRLFVHAGFTSRKGPKNEHNQTELNRDRSLWDMAVSMQLGEKPSQSFHPEKLDLFKEIYIGHTPTLYLNEEVPMQAHNVWNLDTGAAFTGKLSIMDIDTKQYWQSDPVHELYPGEMGRNRNDR